MSSGFKTVYRSVLAAMFICGAVAILLSFRSSLSPTDLSNIANLWHAFFVCLGFCVGGFATVMHR